MADSDSHEIDLLAKDLQAQSVVRHDLDRFFRVYEIPGDDDGYVLMSPGNAQKWAKEIVRTNHRYNTVFMTDLNLKLLS